MKYIFIVTIIILSIAYVTTLSKVKTYESKINELEAQLTHEKNVNKLSANNGLKVQSESAKPVTQKKINTWIYESKVDEMTGFNKKYAILLSNNTVNFDFPYQGEQHGKLTIRLNSAKENDVIFSIERGQLMCNNGCEIMVKFDDATPESFDCNGPEDNSTETIFVFDVNRFIDKLKKAKKIKISVTAYNEGTQVFDFDVSGLKSEKVIWYTETTG